MIMHPRDMPSRKPADLLAQLLTAAHALPEAAVLDCIRVILDDMDMNGKNLETFSDGIRRIAWEKQRAELTEGKKIG